MDTVSINKEALFSDGTINYRIPPECDPGDTVTIRFRALQNNLDTVFIVILKDNIEESFEMTWISSDDIFDYYEIDINVTDKQIKYYFKAIKDDETCNYTRLGTDNKLNDKYYFCITPGFHVPKWMQGCVIYQIFTDRFSNGDPSNDVLTGEYIYLNHKAEHANDWYSPINTLDVGRFYGGDLQGVLNNLNYLKALGIEAIYFNPLFVSPSNHKYDTQDYEHIDPHYTAIVKDGDYATRSADSMNLLISDEFYIDFVQKCHEAGIKVIMDGVFNHCGSFSKMMDEDSIYKNLPGYAEGAYHSANSPYTNYFNFEDRSEHAWPENKSYEKWWGNTTLPKLNYEGAPELESYMMNIASKWISEPYCADGWRLDVAADLGHSKEYNHHFWQMFRKTVKEINNDAVIFAEHYGDSYEWLQGDQWDSIMNYDAFMEPVGWYITGMEKHSDSYNPDLCGDAQSFFETMKYAQCSMQTGSILSAMNELSNHDHSRFLTRTNKTVGRLASAGAEAASKNINLGLFCAAVVIQMTWPGAPTIYYGDEVGLCGWTDPDSRRPYPWGSENYHLLDFHTYMVNLHKNDVFRYGSWKEVYSADGVIAYGRMLDNKIAITIVNALNTHVDIQIPVWQLGVTDSMTLSRVISADDTRYNVGLHHRTPKSGYLRCHMSPYSSKVYINWADCEHNIKWTD